jgi:histidine ammonia-lyase
LKRMLGNLRNIVAIELLSACQGIDLLAPLKTGTLAQKAYEAVRTKSRMLAQDRPLAPEIAVIAGLIESGDLAKLVR